MSHNGHNQLQPTATVFKLLKVWMILNLHLFRFLLSHEIFVCSKKEVPENGLNVKTYTL